MLNLQDEIWRYLDTANDTKLYKRLSIKSSPPHVLKKKGF